MNSKWADYAISEVRYNASRTHIAQVIVREDLGERLSQPSIQSRQWVIEKLAAGNSFITVRKSDGKWVKGANVGAVKLNGTLYLRTDGNSIAADNLGELPEF